MCGSICRAWLSTAAGCWTGSRTCTATCTATRAARTSSSTGARRRPAGMLPTAWCQRTRPNFWYVNIYTDSTHGILIGFFLFLQLLPHILQQTAPAFALNHCNFKVERGREATARVALWRQLGITRSYTLESSYCGCDQGLYQVCARFCLIFRNLFWS